MPEIPNRLITYCTNVHPAETWRATFAALKKHVPAVKAAVSPDRLFPIGLRLSNRGARELTPEENVAFKAWLEEEECFVPTINGFPYGAFHGKLLKKKVYLPDWRSVERADYTILLAELLAGWLPAGMSGSISTVPLGYKRTVGRFHDPLPEMKRQLQLVLTRLSRIYEQRGKNIVLALEPEPGCLLETTDEVCRFFDSLDLPDKLRKHLGICYDCCHQAVEFEDPVYSLKKLSAAGVPVAKVQVSSALSVTRNHAFTLTPFDEPFYLHQVAIRHRDGGLTRYDDLTEAIFHHPSNEREEWRCHFHVPIFTPSEGRLQTTSQFITDLLPMVPDDLLLEVETYTWSVLPAELRRLPLTDSIIREIKWVKERRHA
jgi:hypothetical protein